MPFLYQVPHLQEGDNNTSGKYVPPTVRDVLPQGRGHSFVFATSWTQQSGALSLLLYHPQQIQVGFYHILEAEGKSISLATGQKHEKNSYPSRNFALMFNYWNTFARETEIPQLTEGSTYSFKAAHCREHFLPIIPALHGFPVGVQVLMQIYKIPHSLASEISGTFCRQRCIHTTPACLRAWLVNYRGGHSCSSLKLYYSVLICTKKS